MDFTNARRVHFVGIGGIGMSALAQLFLHEGKQVTGSDREHQPTIELLEHRGARVFIGHEAHHVPKGTELLVCSDAIQEDNPEVIEARRRGIPERTYFEMLGEVTDDRTTIAVAGTHGKTTTTAMLVKILHEVKARPTAIIGSLAKDFGGNNFVEGEEELFVVEACEYRDHLLKLHPKILVITNIEWDHSDWFKDLAAVQETFKRAVTRLPEDGVLVTNPGDQNIAPVLEGYKGKVMDYTSEDVPELQLIGEFNRMNAKAAKAAAKAFNPNIEESTVRKALTEFQGAWRRFEKKGTMQSGALVYDDYAHHPTAIRETLKAAREHFPSKEITVVFHPHLYSRTSAFLTEFAHELAQADSVVLAPIYAAREMNMSGVSSDQLAEEVAKENENVLSLETFDAIEKELRGSAKEKDLVITMGAGDIYKVADKLVQR